MTLLQELEAEAKLVRRAAALDHCLTPGEAAGTAKVLRKAAQALAGRASVPRRPAKRQLRPTPRPRPHA